MKGTIHMKFDVVRAWKDETYRQTLSDEQLEMLPANPAGELNDAEMAAVNGGNGGFGDGFGFGAASSSSSSSKFAREHSHSFSLICDISIFSLNVVQLNIIPIASEFHQTCVESH